MRLSCRGRYSMRAMIELSKNHNDMPLPLSVIEEKQGISKKYLNQLMNSLKVAGLVRVIRGKHGGYILAKKPSEITMADILYAIEGDMSLVDCVIDKNLCDKHNECISRNIWVELSDLINNYLQSITLEDLLKKE